jgi:hypothetical protein
LNQELQFERVIPFYQGAPAFYLDLIGPANHYEVLVTLDTGSRYSLFSGSYATDIGLDLLSGKETTLWSLGGAIQGYLHGVVLEIAGSKFSAEVVFSLNHIPRALLGRHTVFEQMTWGLRESRREIYFSPRP